MERRKRYNTLPSEKMWTKPQWIALTVVAVFLTINFVSTESLLGFYIVALFYVAIIAVHSVICKSFPLHKFQETSVVFVAVLVLLQFANTELTQPIAGLIIALSLFFSHFYDDGYVYEILLSRTKPESGSDVSVHTHTINTEFMPLYKQFLLTYLPKPIQPYLFDSGITATVISGEAGEEKPNLSFKFDSKQEFLDDFVDPVPFGSVHCSVCDEKGIHTGPYTANTNRKQRKMVDVFLCDECRQMIVEQSVNLASISEEELLVNSV